MSKVFRATYDNSSCNGGMKFYGFISEWLRPYEITKEMIPYLIEYGDLIPLENE